MIFFFHLQMPLHTVYSVSCPPSAGIDGGGEGLEGRDCARMDPPTAPSKSVWWAEGTWVSGWWTVGWACGLMYGVWVDLGFHNSPCCYQCLLTWSGGLSTVTKGSVWWRRWSVTRVVVSEHIGGLPLSLSLALWIICSYWRQHPSSSHMPALSVPRTLEGALRLGWEPKGSGLGLLHYWQSGSYTFSRFFLPLSLNFWVCKKGSNTSITHFIGLTIESQESGVRNQGTEFSSQFPSGLVQGWWGRSPSLSFFIFKTFFH